ncbi:MAG: hypothetical protein GQF41_2371 [Candidatus Rifleibacterium amylolyticum]|nr:MAG: hypothetical protein GQF41_2371 [Candidatus Rifleibacterium amylolyticum]
MSKIRFYVLIPLLAVVLCSNSALARFQTTEDLIYGLAYADEKKSIQMVDDFAVANPQMTKEILLLQNPRYAFQNRAKKNAFNCFKRSSYRGIVTREEFFDIAFTLIANIDMYHSPLHKEEALAWYRGGLAYYGFNPQIKVKTYQDLIALFDNVFGILTSMEKSGLIVNSGLTNSLLVKLRGAKDAIEKHKEKGVNQAINKIEASINEANAQNGKHFKPDGCSVFIKYCSNLIDQIKVTDF